MQNSDKIAGWIISHPKTVRAATIGLVAFGAWNLYRAIKLDFRAELLFRSLKAEAQKATSEGLGG